MSPVVRSLTSLLSAVAILFVGSGLLGVLTPIRAQIEGFPTVVIGTLGTAYYIGFVAGCFYGSRVIHAVGHVRTFAALAAIAASVALMHAMLVHMLAWIVLRGVLGFCFAGLYMVIESWLNSGAENHIRGRLLSIYMVVNMAGLTTGKMLLATAEPLSFILFGVVSICISLALVPLSLTRSVVPSPPDHVALNLRLYETAPIGVIGCIAIGLTNGAFWSLAPLFAESRFASTRGVAVFMSVVVIGALVAVASRLAVGPDRPALRDRATGPRGACRTCALADHAPRPAPGEERTVFKEVPPTSPALYQLDPRAPSETASPRTTGT